MTEKTSRSDQNREIVPEKKATDSPAGCIGVFFQFLDWNRRIAKRKFFPKKLLQQDRPTKNRSKQSDREARLHHRDELLRLSRSNSIKPGVVARLMGLDSMPAVPGKKKPKKLLHNFSKRPETIIIPSRSSKRSPNRLMEAASKILEPAIHRRKVLSPSHSCSYSDSSCCSSSYSRERNLRRRSSSSSHGELRRIEELSFLLGQKIRELSSPSSAAAVLEELVAALSSSSSQARERCQGERSPMSILEAPLSDSFNSSSGFDYVSPPGHRDPGIRVSKNRSREAVSMVELLRGKKVEEMEGDLQVYAMEWGLELEEDLVGMLIDDIVFDLLR